MSPRRVVAGLGVLAAATALTSAARAEERVVGTSAALREAIAAARPGDVITLTPGTFDLEGNLVIRQPGAPEQPIVVRAQQPGAVFIRFDAVEGFHVTQPDWRFEDLDIEGRCERDDTCEHAFHITGAADRTRISRCRLHEFNAMIKGNGDEVGGVRVWPDDVVIEGSELFNSRPRQTGNPVTPIDVVGGRRWIVRDNFIHDHAKAGGNEISYAAFLKGNSRDGVFERNLVICELLHTGHVRLGLSFGGGGTGPDPICEDSTCTPEHQNGVMRNNIILRCPQDVGIYLNAAANTRLLHNTLYDTTGIDVRFPTSSAEVRYNLLTGRVRERDGATLNAADNLAGLSNGDLEGWFQAPGSGELTLVDGAALVDQAAPRPDVTDDFCGRPRGANPDMGALEYEGTSAPCAVLNPDREEPPDAGPDAPAEDAEPSLDGGEDAVEDAAEDVEVAADAPPDPGPDDEGLANNTGAPNNAAPNNTGAASNNAQAPGPGADAGEDTDAGCACATPGRSGAPGGAALVLVGLVGVGVARRRARRG